jgi:hypothetical protein
VVPDSGTGELTGISGRLHINVEADGTHNYTLDYALDESSDSASSSRESAVLT